MGNIITVFLTGLLTGGLTCMAVQGGLLAASLAQTEEERLEEKAKGGNALPILAFLATKLAAYTLLGLLLGSLGSVFKFSLSFTIFLQLAISVFMIGTALSILNVHPVFRYFIIQPPKFLTRMIRGQSKNKSLFGPAILGALTIFIPCGTTQAMMALAVASGSPVIGATIMFAFILGTSPVFFILGYFATKLGDMFHDKFMKVAAVAIILLALFNINNAITLTGTSLTPGNILKNFWCTVSFCNDNSVSASNEPAVTEANINIRSLGYQPNSITVKAGSKVTLNLKNIDGTSCIQSFTIPQLGIQRIIRVGTSDTITFTAPNNPGPLAFMCSMGMFRGVINVL